MRHQALEVMESEDMRVVVPAVVPVCHLVMHGMTWVMEAASSAVALLRRALLDRLKSHSRDRILLWAG